MKKKIFGVLQRIGRSFMLPIAVLPIAGMFLGIGSSLTNEATIASLGLEWYFRYRNNFKSYIDFINVCRANNF